MAKSLIIVESPAKAATIRSTWMIRLKSRHLLGTSKTCLKLPLVLM